MKVILDEIINRTVSSILLEYQRSKSSESSTKSGKDRLADLVDKLNSKGKKKKKKKSKDDEDDDNEVHYKTKKKAGGHSIQYNYDQWQIDHPKESQSETNDLIDTIDVDYVDVAAVARDIYPDHTDEGAQSQLRKVLNKERPLTSDVAKKIRNLIAAGKIPVK